MAEQKESKVKKRQLTLTFDVTRPGQEKLWEDLKTKAAKWRKPRQELAVVAIFHGLKAAEARVQAEYEAALKRDDALFAPLDTPAAETPQADTPAAETPQADTPAAETPQADTPAAETPQVDTPAAETPQADTPASVNDPGKWVDSTQRPDNCKGCKRDVPAKSRVRYFSKDKTMLCEECAAKAA